MLTARPVDPELVPTLCIDTDTAARWLRADTGNTGEGEEVEALVRSAMAWAEDYCKQPLFERDYYGYGESFREPDICLHSLNVTAVKAVDYQLKGSPDWHTLSPTEYTWWETGELNFYDDAQRIRGIVRIRVTYTAGYAKTGFPANILQAVRLLIGRWYDNRADEKKEVPSMAEWLVRSHVMPIL